MHAFITTDKFIGEHQAWHEATLLEPETQGERSGEEDTLDSGEGNQVLGECQLLAGDPAHSLVHLTLDTRDGLDGVE